MAIHEQETVSIPYGEPKWPALDPENGDFTDGWNQAIDLCKEAFSKWATPKPIGDVEAVARKIVRYYSRAKFPHVAAKHNLAIIAILSPFFAPAGRISDKTLNAIVQDVAELPDRTSPDDWPEAMLVTAEELKAIISGNIEESAQPPCSECATLRKERDEAKLAAKYECVQKAIAIEQSLADSDRAEAAEAQLSTQLQAFKDAQDSLNDALSHLRHSSNENAIIYVKEGLTFISAALAPTPEVAKEGKL